MNKLTKLKLLKNKLHFIFQFKKIDGKYTVILPDKYKKPIKMIKYVLSVIGLFSAFIIFKTVFIAFLFGLGLFLIGKLIERTTFSYFTMFVHPLPDFKVDMAKWIGTGFCYYPDPQNANVEIPVVSWIFSDKEYATNIHNLMFAWSYGNYEDKDKNISLSVILHNNNQYTFYCYPSLDRKFAKLFHNYIENETLKEKSTRDDIHNKLFLIFIIGKLFDMPSTSYLPLFKQRYSNGDPFIFCIMYAEDISKTPSMINGINKFIFHTLKIKSDGELTRQDIEYDLIRMN